MLRIKKRIEQDRYTAMLEAADLYISDQNIPPRMKEANLRVMGEHLCGLADGLKVAEENRLIRAAELLRAADTQDTTEAIAQDIWNFNNNITVRNQDAYNKFLRFLRERLGRS